LIRRDYLVSGNGGGNPEKIVVPEILDLQYSKVMEVYFILKGLNDPTKVKASIQA
jgi:hypothetical protein